MRQMFSPAMLLASIMPFNLSALEYYTPPEELYSAEVHGFVVQARTNEKAVDDDNFDQGRGLGVVLAYRFYGPLSIELGLRNNSKVEDSGEDDVGEYKLTMEDQDLTLGLAAGLLQYDVFSLVGRVGAVYWETDWTLTENFVGQRKGGEVKAEEQGSGIYYGLGIKMDLVEFYGIGEIGQLHRRDQFENSVKSFDVKAAYVSVGLGMRF